MSMTRRELFKVAGVVAAGAAVASTATGCTTETGTASAAGASNALLPAPKGNRVVVIGAGFGGLTLAKNLRKLHKGAEVVVLEKNDIFMACPFSNTYLGGLEGVKLSDLTHDYYATANKYGYSLIQTEVTSIDRGSKTVHSTKGPVQYDLLVLAPGIAYNYESQFKGWDAHKAEAVRRAAPPAMIAGAEHLALKRQLENMEDGDVIITVPEGKYRCPPAPYERACMIANWMETEEIDGKVKILDTVPKPRAKAAAFLEAFNDVWKDRIEFIGDTELKDVDLAAKTVSYIDINDEKETVHTAKYEVLNLIPKMKANPVIAMAGVKTNGWGAAVLNGAGFDTVTDKDVYVVGDAVAHRIPPSGQTANWAGKRAAHQIAARMQGKAFDAKAGLPWKAANVCYSMVGGAPEEGIMVTHTFSFTGKDLKGKGSVPKDPATGKFRSGGTAKATREWFRGIMGDLFA
jgi:NADPH-dependent 2,4-dienoyl-CoA reductase/sulfur reductase-like enzyme